MTPYQSTVGFRYVRCAALVAVLCLTGAEAFAQAEFYPIDGANGGTVACRPSGYVERTGRRYGSSATITACILAADAPFGLPGLSFTFYCRGGFPVQFHPATGRLRSCTLNSNASFPGITNAPVACGEGLKAEFGTDGRVVACNLPNTTPSGGTGGGTGITITPPGASGGGHPPLVVGGESARLAGGGQLTLIGASSNRPGSRGGYLYLGDGRASASYDVQVPAAGRYALWIRFDDDGQHPAGARGVEISVNGAVALRWNNESRDLKGWTNIPVGSVDLRAGANTIVFTKAATTSAAFVLDEFVLSDEPGFVPR